VPGAGIPLSSRPRATLDLTGISASPDEVALFLDLDGTLIDIAESPEEVEVPRDLPEMLVQLGQRLGGALAIVSGRTIGTIDGLLAPARLTTAGVHGTEIRFPGGKVESEPRVPALEAIRAELADFVDRRPPLILEDKITALGVHYRADPRFEPEVEFIMRRLAAGANGALTVQPGKMVVEMRASGGGKGRALTTIMARPPFSGRTPIAIGDDLTDEDMFIAANALGGHSIRVGDEDSVTHARLRLRDPRHVRRWLRRYLELPPVVPAREHNRAPDVVT
jgi:trehalose 6-phosphate phosphatase